MTSPRHSLCASHKGFTLIESIIALVIMAIAAAGIASMQKSIFTGQTAIQQLQVGTQLMQECAEQVLATRRGPGGYAAISDGSVIGTAANFGPNLCGKMLISPFTPVFTTGFNSGGIPTVVIDRNYVGTGCPSAVVGTCKLVSISQAGLTPLTLLLVNY